MQNKPYMSITAPETKMTYSISVNTAKSMGGAATQSSLANPAKPGNAVKKNVSVKEDGKPSLNGRSVVVCVCVFVQLWVHQKYS